MANNYADRPCDECEHPERDHQPYYMPEYSGTTCVSCFKEDRVPLCEQYQDWNDAFATRVDGLRLQAKELGLIGRPHSYIGFNPVAFRKEPLTEKTIVAWGRIQ